MGATTAVQFGNVTKKIQIANSNEPTDNNYLAPDEAT
jgi:hypothetical protein